MPNMAESAKTVFFENNNLSKTAKMPNSQYNPNGKKTKIAENVKLIKMAEVTEKTKKLEWLN